MTPYEAWRVSGALDNRGDELIERRGLNAKVTTVDDRTLQIFLPALIVSEEDARKEALGAVASIIGAERFRVLWESPVWRKFATERLRLAKIGTDLTGTLVKLSEERTDNPALPPPMREAHVRFEGEAVARTSWSSGMPERYSQLSTGYLSLVAEDLGWSTFAKAPLGFLQHEPILGPPKGNPMVWVIHNLDTGKAEIRNLRGPGSVEVVDVGKSESADNP